jgi:hypothetical protein
VRINDLPAVDHISRGAGLAGPPGGSQTAAYPLWIEVDPNRGRGRLGGRDDTQRVVAVRSSPDPESGDVNHVCQPVFELSRAPRAA